MTRKKIQPMSGLPTKQKVSVELDFYQIDHLLKAHLASFNRSYYDDVFNSHSFAEYLNLTSTLIQALASHPGNKQAAEDVEKSRPKLTEDN